MAYYVMGTGSRSMVVAPDAREIYENLKTKVLQIHEIHLDLVLISGMAEGWDEAIAKVGLRENIPYHCYIPNYGYGAYYWGQHSLCNRNRMNMFNRLVNGAAKVFYSTGSQLYINGEHSNFIRNRHMVAAANHALVYKPTSSGTAHCVRYLKANHVPMDTYPFTNPIQEILF